MINERRVILEKFRKKTHPIWIKYDEEIPFINFNYKSKGQISTWPIELGQSRAATWPRGNLALPSW